MWPAVEIDRVVDRAQPLGMERADFTGQRVLFFSNRQLRRAPPDVVRGVRPTLPFRQRQERSLPAITPKAGGVVDWKAEVIPQFRSRHALGLIFMEPRRPPTPEVDLR